MKKIAAQPINFRLQIWPTTNQIQVNYLFLKSFQLAQINVIVTDIIIVIIIIIDYVNSVLVVVYIIFSSCLFQNLIINLTIFIIMILGKSWKVLIDLSCIQ